MQKLTPDIFVSGMIRGWTPEVFSHSCGYDQNIVYVHTSFSPSHFLTSTPPLLTPSDARKSHLKPLEKEMKLDSYKCLLCINLVACFPQVTFVSKTCCSCRVVLRKGEDGAHTSSEGDNHQNFGLLWASHNEKVRLLSCYATYCFWKQHCRNSDIPLQPVMSRLEVFSAYFYFRSQPNPLYLVLHMIKYRQ